MLISKLFNILVASEDIVQRQRRGNHELVVWAFLYAFKLSQSHILSSDPFNLSFPN